MRTNPPTTLICGLLLLAGCGGSGDSDQPKAPEPIQPPAQSQRSAAVPIDACSLLTKAEVEAVIGQPVPEPGKKQDANITNCE